MNMTTNDLTGQGPSRRMVLTGMGAGLLASAAMPAVVWAQGAPIKLGFQLHRTGIGAAYGHLYERTAQAALKVVNDAGGIAGRPVEIIFEEDGTEPPPPSQLAH